MRLVTRISLLMVFLFILEMLVFGVSLTFVNKYSKENTIKTDIGQVELGILEEITLQEDLKNRMARDLLIYELIELNKVDSGSFYPKSYLEQSWIQSKLKNCEKLKSNIQICEKKNSNRLISFIPLVKEDVLLGYLSLEKESSSSELNLGFVKNIALVLFSALLINLLGVYFFLRKYFSRDFFRMSEYIQREGQGNLPRLKTAEYNQILKKFSHAMRRLKFVESMRSKERTKLEAEKERKTLIQGLAHDIESPIASLRTMALKHAPESDKAVIENTSSRINEIIDLFYDGSTKSSTEEFHLSSVLELLIEEKRIEFKGRKNVSLRFSVKGGAEYASLIVDRGEFQRVISNLINNSLDAIQDQGKISVEVDLKEDFVCISVCDNGKGIPKDLLAEVKKQGFSEGKETGKGLGLFQAEKTVNKFGGSLNINSTEGKGTRVLILFPINMVQNYSQEKA